MGDYSDDTLHEEGLHLLSVVSLKSIFIHVHYCRACPRVSWIIRSARPSCLNSVSLQLSTLIPYAKGCMETLHKHSAGLGHRHTKVDLMSLFSSGMRSRSEVLQGMVMLHSQEQVLPKKVQRAMFTTTEQALCWFQYLTLHRYANSM